MSSPKLTLKQENFVLAYIETGNASEAYRRAYDAQNMKAESIVVSASKLMAQPNIALRVAELKAEAKERCLVTVESLTEELEEARALAKQEGQASAAVAATMGKAKLHKLLTDVIDHKSSDKSMTPTSIDATKLSSDTLKEIMAAHNASNAG